jgi:hypothetical protein
MKTYSIVPVITFAAASVLILSTAAYAGNNGGRGGDRGDRGGRDHDTSFIWKDHENGCAVGNTPPPGANCTNRDDDRR